MLHTDPRTTQTGLQTTLIGAAAGATAAFIVSLLANRWGRWRLHRNLHFEPQPRIGTRATARIYNGYIFPLNCVYAYITIEHELSDVLPPRPPFEAYVTPDHLCTVREDRLCWSTTMPSPNPPVVDIYPGERQALDIVNFDPNWIEIPSESGWGTLRKKSRVFLKAKKYRATIKIISKDTKAKEFPIEIDPDNAGKPVALRNR